MITLLVATRNRHKVDEIRAVLGPGVCCLDLAQLPDGPVLTEDAPTFAGNAAGKAEQMARWWLDRAPDPTGTSARPDFVLADDSGLEVDALNGAPGVHSARFAALDAPDQSKGNAADADNNAKLIRLMAGVPLERRQARFRCVLALTPVRTDDTASPTELFDGVCEGRVDFAPRGQGGFGYDPLFVPEGDSQSFAELGAGVKNGLSHRARALAKLALRFGSGSATLPDRCPGL
jgi:XTP/dITP diphosphohydrolase